MDPASQKAPWHCYKKYLFRQEAVQKLNGFQISGDKTQLS